MQSPAASFRRSSVLPVLLVCGASLAAPGCEAIPPFLERSWIRSSGAVLTERLKVDDDASSGPYPGVALSVGTMLQLERTRSFGLEAEAQAYEADSGDLDGYGFRYSAGTRWQWNLDGRYRPLLGCGINWTDFHFDDHDRSFDPNGPGAYADVGIDWMVTPHHAIGTRLRGILRYEQADHNNGVVPGLELSLHASWSF
jgi:hypothetical protein